MSDFQRFPSDRDEAPAYLSRYNERRREQVVQNAAALADPAGPVSPAERSRAAHSSAAEAQTDSSVAPYVRTALAKAAERALREATLDDAPPGTTAAYAAITVTPREIVPPPAFRSRMTGTFDVRLIRHGETQGYSSDGGLTPLGRWQAHRKGQDLARGIAAGMRVKFVHAPTARAGETASALFEGVLQATARYGIDATLVEPEPNAWFRNFQVWCDGIAQDPTQAFHRYSTILESHERSKAGDRPGWIVEMDRFWSTQAAGGDPITIWLSQPLQYFEPAALVVRRFWRGIVEALSAPDKPNRLFVATHSGPIRAVAAAAVGHDPGEPYNVEDVRIRVYADLQHAIVTYRGRGVEIEIPTSVAAPPWCT
jgi:broad specificity phosphatase PhoE